MAVACTRALNSGLESASARVSSRPVSFAGISLLVVAFSNKFFSRVRAALSARVMANGRMSTWTRFGNT